MRDGSPVTFSVVPQLVTGTPGRVSFQIPAAMVQLAVRLVHAVLDLRTRRSPAVVRAAS